MPMWRCPHCRTPQAEAARCWVCHRSSTSCATCVNFRHAVFGGTGYCGLDRRRDPLAGDEIRACWSSPIALVAGTAAVDAGASSGEHPFAPKDAAITGGANADPLRADHPSTLWVELDT
jgi:hypothetical protein